MTNYLNIEIENIVITETESDIGDDLEHLARIIAQNSTLELFYKYKEDSINIRKEMIEYDMIELAELFRIILPEYKKRAFKHKYILTEIMNIEDEKLFMPYGVLQPPFENSANKFIEKAEQEREVANRDTYRLLIKKRKNNNVDKLIGGFVVDTLPVIKDYNTYQIGDIGIFMHPEETLYQYKVMMKLYDKLRLNIMEKHMIKMNNESDRIVALPDIIITATTHPLNYNTRSLLDRLSFYEVDRGISKDYGHRIFFSTTWSELQKALMEDELFNRIAKKCNVQVHQ